MDESVDAAGQADEYAEIGDRLDEPFDLVALFVIDREFFPGIGHALFHSQRNAPALLVDLENHHLDFVAKLHDLGRMDVLVGPVHLGDVHQPLDALLDFDKRAVIGEVGDLAEQPCARGVAARETHPRIFAELLHAQRHAILFLVELEDLGGHLVTDREHFGRMLDAAPRQVSDVQEAVDATEIDERAVIGDVLDDALDDRAFLQRLEQLFPLGAEACLEHCAA